MTDRKALPDRGTKQRRVEQKLLDNLKEHVPDVPYPLEFSVHIRLREVKDSVFRELGISMPPLDKVIRMDENSVPALAKAALHLNLRLPLLPFTVCRFMKLGSSGAAEKEEQRLALVLGDLKKENPASLPDKQLMEFIEKALETAFAFGRIRFRAHVFPMVLRGSLLKILLRFAKLPAQLNQFDFLAGLEHKTVIIEKALYTLAAAVQALPGVCEIITTLPAEKQQEALEHTPEGIRFLADIRKFLDEHGARTMKASLLFSNSSWREEPRQLFNTLSAILRSAQWTGHREKIDKAGEKFTTLKNEMTDRLPRFLHRSFLQTLEKFRRDYRKRESLLYAMEECYMIVRKGVREAALRLQEKGLLTGADDVKFLTMQELSSALHGNLPEQDRDRWRARRQHRPEAELVWQGAAAETDTGGSDLLCGLPGSPGTARGTARIIRGPAEFNRLQQGDVLVCTFTDPAWTPLFTLAAAIVSDTGGPLSHAAIVAREYSIPAVLGTNTATSRLKDGDEVIVNGTKGTVALCRA